MQPPCRTFRKIKPRKLGCLAVLACVLVPMAIFGVLNFSSRPLGNLVSLQLPIRPAYMPLSTTRVEETKSSEMTDTEMTRLSLNLGDENGGGKSDADVNTRKLEPVSDEKQEPEHTNIDSNTRDQVLPANIRQDLNYTDIGIGEKQLPLAANGKKEQNKPIAATGLPSFPLNLDEEDIRTETNGNKGEQLVLVSYGKQEPDYTNNKTTEQIIAANVKHEPNYTKQETPEKESPLTLNDTEEQNNLSTDDLIPQTKVMCDLSGPRSDTCFIQGDLRILMNSSVILLASSSQLDNSNTTWRIRPYARKWETNVMEYIKEITLTSVTPKENAYCTVNHSVPAAVFSTGGFLGNLFHDFTDVLIPLFTTTSQYQGEVQFLATNFNSRWIDKYKPILKRLSRFEIINMDTDTRVHCFQNVHVGLQSDKVMGIDPSKSPNGYSMADFREFLRESLSLKRRSTKMMESQPRRRPRLLILLRRGSRSIINAKEVTQMARRVGYKVVTAGPEKTRNLTWFARTVNSCDVMMGVHGAGLANMVFLPTNATLIQVIPWGGLTWACRHDFGEPASDMGIRYLEYEIKEEESSLIQIYPRNHAVFTDPESIQKQGWNMLWSIFLDKQKVKLDVRRFRPILVEALESVKQ